MRADQTTYAACVANLGLERGIGERHGQPSADQQYYAAVQRGVVPEATLSPQSVEPRVLRKGLFSNDVETPEAIAERLTKAVNEDFRNGRYGSTIGRRTQGERGTETRQTASEAADSIQGPFKGLTKARVTESFEVAMTFQLENKRAEQAQKLCRGRTKDAPRRGQGGRVDIMVNLI